MSTHLSVHQVAKIVTVSDGFPDGHKGDIHWWQTLHLYGCDGQLIGLITLHLTDASAALPIGHWRPGFATETQMPALEAGEVAPF